METTIIVVALVVLFVITWIVIACNSCNHDLPRLPDPAYTMKPSFYEQMKDQTISRLTDELANLKFQNEWLKRTHCPLPCELSGRLCKCERPIYAKTPDEQVLIDLVKEMGKPLAEIKKELGIK